jgi:hypothetical protein
LPPLAAFASAMQNYTPNVSPSEVATLEVGTLDVRCRATYTNTKSAHCAGRRGKIRELSRQSRTRLLHAARNGHAYQAILTLTVPHEDLAEGAAGGDYMRDGAAVKAHLQQVRKFLTYRKISGLWFLEFQKRGAPHFHLFLDRELHPDQVERLRDWWYLRIGSGDPKHRRRGVDHQVLRKPHAAGAYAAKYSTKNEQKTVPEQYQDVGRFWGHFGKRLTSEQCEVEREKLVQVARFARRAEKALRRSEGFPPRNSRTLSSVRYGVARLVREFVYRAQILPDSLARSLPTIQRLHMRPSAPPSPEDSEAGHVRADGP